MLQGIVLRGNAGMAHMQRSITYTIKLVDAIKERRGVIIPIYFQWCGWNCFDQIFKVMHSQFELSNINVQNYKKLYIEQLHPLIEFPDSYIDNILQHKGLAVVDNRCQTTFTIEKHFQTFKITQQVKAKLQECIQQLGTDYVAVNCRGSDYIKLKYKSVEEFIEIKSDLLNSLKKLYTQQKIVLCTDSQKLAAMFVDNKHIFSFGVAYQLHERGLILDDYRTVHGLRTGNEFQLSEYDINLDGVIDHYLMFTSKKTHADSITGFGQRAAAAYNFLKDKSMEEKWELICE